MPLNSHQGKFQLLAFYLYKVYILNGTICSSRRVHGHPEAFERVSGADAREACLNVGSGPSEPATEPFLAKASRDFNCRELEALRDLQKPFSSRFVCNRLVSAAETG